MEIKDFFNREYKEHKRYWWLNENRYSLDTKDHLPYYSEILKEAMILKEGRVLDIGAGEGSDSIRLALLGLEVDAVELTQVGSEKIEKFSKSKGVKINILNQNINDLDIQNKYDIILCNGVLHYIEDKISVLQKIKNATKVGGINAISLFSDFSPTPQCHEIIPVYPDSETGIIVNSYKNWKQNFKNFERNKQELSHPGFEEHSHSFIKIISKKYEK